MEHYNLAHLGGAFGAALIAGAINSVAGGGTLVSFPILIALGLPPIVANATNTVGIWPGSIGSMLGFRRELRRVPRAIFWLLIPTVIGSSFGAWLLRVTSPVTFERIIPWLILFATALFMVQAPIQRWLRSAETVHAAGKSWFVMALVAQLFVAVYGGYFGAGMSIIMLSILGIIGMTDILEMSATTSLFGCAINGVAGMIFGISGLVDWPYVPVMAVGALAGGYWAAGAARRIGKVAIRRFVIGVGLTIALVMFFRVLG